MTAARQVAFRAAAVVAGLLAALAIFSVPSPQESGETADLPSERAEPVALPEMPALAFDAQGVVVMPAPTPSAPPAASAAIPAPPAFAAAVPAPAAAPFTPPAADDEEDDEDESTPRPAPAEEPPRQDGSERDAPHDGSIVSPLLHLLGNVV